MKKKEESEQQNMKSDEIVSEINSFFTEVSLNNQEKEADVLS